MTNHRFAATAAPIRVRRNSGINQDTALARGHLSDLAVALEEPEIGLEPAEHLHQ